MKTITYIDGANLQKSLPSIDYSRLYDYLTQKHKSTDIYLFLGHLKSQEKTYKQLKKLGYNLVFKEAVYTKGKTKANVDAELILHATSHTYELKPKKSILISGDGDFSCLLDFWKKKKIKPTVLAPQKSSCSSLIQKRNIKIKYLESPKIYNQIKITSETKSLFKRILDYIKTRIT
jgi:uncharacterized LabA/DUF88 family protein